jgi:dipeptidase E
MKLLLTSESITNDSIAQALRELVGKPIDQSKLLYIPTSYNGASGDKSWFVQNINNAHKMGWKSFEIIDIAAVHDLPPNLWLDPIKSADVIFMGGGANYYLGYWLEKTGLMDLLPQLLQTKVYVGSSAGSMVLTKGTTYSSQFLHYYGKSSDIPAEEWGPKGQSSDKTLELVDFYIRPHLGADGYDYLTEKLLTDVSKTYESSVYVLDNESAIKIDGGDLEVVSEGEWYHIDKGIIDQDKRVKK